MLRVFFARLREPSTLSGLAVLGMLFGADPIKLNAGLEALTVVLAAGAVILPDTKATAAPAPAPEHVQGAAE